MPGLSRKMAAVMGAVLFVAAVFAGGSAVAQTGGYPPGTTVPSCTEGNTNAGNVSVGQTITFTLCGNFAPGATVTVTVNGGVVLTKTPTNGAVVVVITVVSPTVLQVDDPVNAPAVCGTNTVTATGASANAGTGTSTGTFNLLCAGPTTSPTSTTVSGSTSTAATSAPTTTPSHGGLAFTGARVLSAILIALALIVLGALLVAFQRRRRQLR